MTIRKLLNSDRAKQTKFPHSIFRAESEDGESHLFCISVFTHYPEFPSLVEKWPNLLDWEVTQEHFTQAELDELGKSA